MTYDLWLCLTFSPLFGYFKVTDEKIVCDSKTATVRKHFLCSCYWLLQVTLSRVKLKSINSFERPSQQLVRSWYAVFVCLFSTDFQIEDKSSTHIEEFDFLQVWIWFSRSYWRELKENPKHVFLFKKINFMAWLIFYFKNARSWKHNVIYWWNP